MPATKRERRQARIDASRPAPQTSANRYASADRASLFVRLDIMGKVRRRGAYRYERQLRASMEACVRSAQRLCTVVLP